MLLGFVFTFFAVHSAAFVVVDGLTLLLFFGHTLLGVVVSAVATPEKAQEEGVGGGVSLSLGHGLGVATSDETQDEEGFHLHCGSTCKDERQR